MEGFTIREWQPVGSTSLLLNLGGLALTVVGLVAYAGIWSAATGASGGSVTAMGLVAAVAMTIALMVIHEGIHGVVFSRFGGTPEYGATMVGMVLPAFFCTSPGRRFTRRQFLLIGLMPALVLVPATAIGTVLLPHGGWLVVPAAMHLGGCVGDVAMALVVARLPPGTLVEDRASGMRLYLPPEVPSPAAT